MSTHLQDNIKTIAAALSSLCVGYATVEYGGSGDEGAILSVGYSNPQQELLCDTLEVPVHTQRYDSTTGRLGHRISQLSISAALEECSNQALDAAGHENYGNDEGGYGTFTVCASGYAVLEHNDNGEDAAGAVEAYAFEPPANALAESGEPSPGQFTQADVWRVVQPLAAALVAAGATVATLTYEGSGDSGDAESVACYDARNAEIDMLDVEVECFSVCRQYDPGLGQFVLRAERGVHRFEDGICDLFDFLVEQVMGHQGWEADEGASGTLNLFADGRVSVEHSARSQGEPLADVESWNDELRAEHEKASGYGGEF